MSDKLNAVRSPDVTSNPGLAVDAGGNPVVDPSRNVLDLAAAGSLRQDDLRKAAFALLEAKVEGLTELISAKVEGVYREFSLIESRRQEQKVDTKTAVDAALSAAEKAVKEQQAASEKSILKSETAAAEQSKQNAATFTAALKGVTDGMNDLKERVGKFETQLQTRADSRVDSRSNVGMIVGVVGAIIGALMFTIAMITMFMRL